MTGLCAARSNRSDSCKCCWASPRSPRRSVAIPKPHSAQVFAVLFGDRERCRICSGDIVRILAAANSIADGRPSSREQMPATASLFSPVISKPGTTAAARSANRVTSSYLGSPPSRCRPSPDGVDNGRTRTTTSPAISSGSRLVARIRGSGQADNRTRPAVPPGSLRPTRMRMVDAPGPHASLIPPGPQDHWRSLAHEGRVSADWQSVGTAPPPAHRFDVRNNAQNSVAPSPQISAAPVTGSPARTYGAVNAGDAVSRPDSVSNPPAPPQYLSRSRPDHRIR